MSFCMLTDKNLNVRWHPYICCSCAESIIGRAIVLVGSGRGMPVRFHPACAVDTVIGLSAAISEWRDATGRESVFDEEEP